MASYKVPQNVEADDKLLGPFSFRQFIYLIIVVMAGALAWGLSQLFIGLVILPIPIIIFFGALALPLRKDQPMEIYMAAMVSYYLKPRLRRWDPEGVETLIEITAPKTVEVTRTKDLSQNEAEERLSYLANIVDSGGWAIRGVANPVTNSSLNTDIYLEAQSAEDILDPHTGIAQNFDTMMTQSTERIREEARARMLEPVSAPVVATPQPAPVAYQQSTTNNQIPEYNPYPTFNQSVIQPLNDASHQATNGIVAPPPAQTAPVQAPVTQAYQQTAPQPAAIVDESAKGTSDIQLTTDIINLANNPDISIETIAHEAERIHKKADKQESDEVVISLR